MGFELKQGFGLKFNRGDLCSYFSPHLRFFNSKMECQMTNSKLPTSNGDKKSIPQYQLIDIDKLQPYTNNAKKHPQKQVAQIKASIQQFGFIAPIVTDSDYLIIAGHGRWTAAKELDLKQVPVIMVEHLSEAEVRAYRLADNQLTMNTGYDDGILKIEVTELIDMDLDFDIEVIGFETAELDIIVSADEGHECSPDDDVPNVDGNYIPTTQLGDIWTLGQHILICGDSLKEETYQTLLNEELADAIFCDPPYNVAIDGHVCGNGKIKHDEFAMASGEMSDEEFTLFLIAFILHMIRFSRVGSLHYICMDWRHISHLLNAGLKHYTELKNICVWNKDNGGMGSLYRSKHELVPVFKNGTAPHINNIELGKYGRYRTNVWDYKGVNSFGGQDDLAMHPTVKPVAMIIDAIKDCTKRSQIVLDPFAGSGSTLIACEKSGRIARCIELEPKYCDVIIQRWQNLTGLNAAHKQTNKIFNEMTSEGGTSNE